MSYCKNLLNGEESKRELKNRNIARHAATEGIVLLENDGVLPLKPGKIALFGAGASRTIKGGTGSGEVNERYSVSILEGLEKAEFQIVNKRWIKDYENDYSKAVETWGNQMKEAMKISRLMKMGIEIGEIAFIYPFGRAIKSEDIKNSETDTAIYVIARQSGEGKDRKIELGENDLQSVEIRSIKFLKEHFKKVILVINSGCTLNLKSIDDFGVNAILYFCQQGEEGGTAFADIISGKVSPSGKLTCTWAKDYADIPFSNEFSYLNGNVKDEFYKEGIFVGYRYYDSFQIEPRYEFGFGLSYTQFNITVKTVKTEKTMVTVVAQVENVGTTPGKEVVQLYISAPKGRLYKEYQRLVDFEKTGEIAPGERQDVILEFDLTDCASYDEGLEGYLLEAGDYIVRIGSSSKKATCCAAVNLDKEAIVSRNTRICPCQTEFEELSCNQVAETIDDIQKFSVSASDIQTKQHEYGSLSIHNDNKTDEIMSKLSVKDMIRVVVGTGFGKQPKFNVPGAVANTTSELYDKGLINIALADGPAGLRLQRRSAMTKKGFVKMLDYQFEFLRYLPKIIKMFLVGNPKKDTILYQYSTAFPVGMSLAQTWNKKLLEEVGRAISEEMQEFGVTYWLAPAMNIVRNPLCGRNFEYYSEDPFIAGTVGACIVKGVQSIHGNYATIKHFACNNQEENRDHVSSNVKERTLREIYLKGFEIAVKKSGVKSIMTSYNKINGVYTSTSYDLLTKTLRNEWGFDGVVMTDWFATKKGCGDNAETITAGNDLIMPGGKYYEKDLLQAYKEGRLKEQDLRRCCANVVNSIVQSAVYEEVKNALKC